MIPIGTLCIAKYEPRVPPTQFYNQNIANKIVEVIAHQTKFGSGIGKNFSTADADHKIKYGNNSTHIVPRSYLIPISNPGLTKEITTERPYKVDYANILIQQIKDKVS